MIKVFKLVNNEWQEIENILQGLTFTEVLDDSLDTGLIQYDSLSDELMPIFTPIKVEHYHKPNDSKKVANNNLTIIIQSNGLYKCSGGDYYSLFGDVIVGDIIYLNNQTNKITKGIYKVVSASGFDIYLENLDEFFLSAEERVTPFTKANPITYRHQLIVVEPTKYLEKIMVNNLCLTNKNDTLKQQLDKALTNCMLLEASESPIFSVSSELSAFLGQTPGEDFFFDKANLREILDGILATVNARVYIEQITDFDNILISYVDMNEVKETIEFEKMVSMERNNNAEMFAGAIEAQGQNSVIPHTVVQDWSSFKTTEATLTTDNMTISTDFPIERIIKAYVLCEIELYQTLNATDPFHKIVFNSPINLTEAIFDSEAYKLLDDRNPNNAYDITARNSIYYVKNERDVIVNQTNRYFLGLTSSKLRLAIQDACVRAYERGEIIGMESKPYPIDHAVFNGLLTDSLIRIEYIPYIDTYTKISKPGMYDNQRARLSLPDNQSEKVISSTRHGLNLLGKITGLGNDDYAVDDLVSNITEIKNIGDKTTDNYIIYKKEISYFNEHAKVRYTLSKNYNNLNEKIGINREKRIYDIPLTGYTNEVLIKSYILVGFNNLASNGLIRNQGIKSFMGKILSPVNRLVLGTKANNVELGLWELSVAKYTMANCMHFVSQTLDNFSVGYSIGGQVVGGKKVLYNPYIDENGEFDSFKVFLADERLVDNTIGIIQQNKLMPQTKDEYYYSSLRLALGEYKYFKDAYQQMKFNIAIEVLPASSALNSLIIGQKLIEHNGLIKNGVTTFSDAVVYASTTKYGEMERFKTKGVQLTGATITKNTTESIKINYGGPTTNYASFAIGDAVGNLYLACNDIAKLNSNIWFNASDILR